MEKKKEDGTTTAKRKMYVHFWHPDGSFLLREGTDVDEFSELLRRIAYAPTLRKKASLYPQLRKILQPPPEAMSDEEVKDFYQYALFVISTITSILPPEAAAENVPANLRPLRLQLNGKAYVLCAYSTDPENPLLPLLPQVAEEKEKEKEKEDEKEQRAADRRRYKLEIDLKELRTVQAANGGMRVIGSEEARDLPQALLLEVKLLSPQPGQLLTNVHVPEGESTTIGVELTDGPENHWLKHGVNIALDLKLRDRVKGESKNICTCQYQVEPANPCVYWMITAQRVEAHQLVLQHQAPNPKALQAESEYSGTVYWFIVLTIFLFSSHNSESIEFWKKMLDLSGRSHETLQFDPHKPEDEHILKLNTKFFAFFLNENLKQDQTPIPETELEGHVFCIFCGVPGGQEHDMTIHQAFWSVKELQHLFARGHLKKVATGVVTQFLDLRGLFGSDEAQVEDVPRLIGLIKKYMHCVLCGKAYSDVGHHSAPHKYFQKLLEEKTDLVVGDSIFTGGDLTADKVEQLLKDKLARVNLLDMIQLFK